MRILDEVKDVHTDSPIDLYFEDPKSLIGQMGKEKIRIRGPVHYYVTIDQVKIRAPKDVWNRLEEGVTYRVFYSPRSKWLLSYEKVEHNRGGYQPNEAYRVRDWWNSIIDFVVGE